MRTAVIRVVVDAEGTLSPAAYESGLGRIRELGIEIVASPVEHLAERDREIELLMDGMGPDHADDLVATCSQAFGTNAKAGVITYISRGTDDDARGVIKAFDIEAEVERSIAGEEEIVTVVMSSVDTRRVPESRLHTALEAALNCEVRIIVRSTSSPVGQGTTE